MEFTVPLSIVFILLIDDVLHFSGLVAILIGVIGGIIMITALT